MGAIESMTAYGVRYPLHARKMLLGFQAHDVCLHKISCSTLNTVMFTEYHRRRLDKRMHNTVPPCDQPASSHHVST